MKKPFCSFNYNTYLCFMKDKIIEKFKETKSAFKIMKDLQLSSSMVYKVLYEEKLLIKTDWEKVKNQCINLYNKGHSIKEIHEITGRDHKKISKLLNESGIVVKKASSYNRKNNFNENYFEKIDSPDKAYFLGLLYADGNVYSARNRVQISLQERDGYILKKFSEAVNSTAKLYKENKEKNGHNNSLRLILDSKKMCQDLINLGCVPKKSLILKFPNDIISNKYLNHFIRGYFDGDGSISISKNRKQCNFTGSELFLTKLSRILSQEGILCSKFYKRYKTENSAGSIFIDRKCIDIFRDYIYNDSNVFLTRKKIKFG